jgi:DNA-binding response OmpR family regulator
LARPERRRHIGLQIRRGQYRFSKRPLIRNGVQISLSNKELQLPPLLDRTAWKVLLREELLSAVRGYTSNVTRTLDVHIASLREKLEEAPHQPTYIQTVRGKGYLFRE